MICGIAVFGLNGCGKSTLAHELAKKTGYFEMDSEDYYFPEQRVSRRCALESNSVAEAAHSSNCLFPIREQSRKRRLQK